MLISDHIQPTMPNVHNVYKEREERSKQSMSYPRFKGEHKIDASSRPSPSRHLQKDKRSSVQILSRTNYRSVSAIRRAWMESRGTKALKSELKKNINGTWSKDPEYHSKSCEKGKGSRV